MALFVLPSDRVETLGERLQTVISGHDGRLFAPESRGVTMGFTSEETASFGCGGRVVALAMADAAPLRDAIPEREGGQRNYLEIIDARVLRRLDPFA